MSTTGRDTPRTAKESGLATKQIKIPPPDAFKGERNTLSAFLTQLDLYIRFNDSQFQRDADKVFFASMYLRGDAFDWFEPIVKDQMQNTKSEREDQTNEIFSDFSKFKEEIKVVFGAIDEQRTAEREIFHLRQKGAAATYAAAFQALAVATEWGDAALSAQFYKGLRDDVKDEIARTQRPDSLRKMIETAIIIDNRGYERRLERKDQIFSPVKKSQKTNDSRRYETQKPYYGPMPMEIDATFRKGGRFQKKGTPRRNGKGKGDNNCYSCGRPGHFARNCQAKPRGALPAKRTYAEVLRTPGKPEAARPSHESMSWTACYDDNCPTH